MTDERIPNDNGDDNALEFAAPVNLARLHPARDVSRFDATVRSIAAGAVAERRRLGARGATGQRSGGALAMLAGWSRPAFAAAALVIVAGAATLLLAPSPASAAPRSLAESAGIPKALVEWSTTALVPSTAEFVGLFDSTYAPRAAGTTP